jgi:peptide/nickel transport system ATP-binding protein/oligopeptide transport system ATP-binding protein
VSDPILSVENLHTSFFTEDGVVPAVDGVSFTVSRGETLGIVGESGCGKSVTSLSLMRLIPDPPGRITEGRVLFHGEDLLLKSEEEMRRIRGRSMSMIFQEPMTSLNPVYPVGDQIDEALYTHLALNRRDTRRRTMDLLRLVGIPSPESRYRSFPFELSGGMRQRIMIAIALACSPDLLIADEPTTALDVTIQAQILELMKETQRTVNSAIIMITHDLGVIAETADRVMVMYAGQAVESTDARTIFDEPQHPYTQGLLRSIPQIEHETDRLEAIEGVVPSPARMPKGCRFHPRCRFAKPLCAERAPELVATAPGHDVRCFIYTDEWEAASDE